VLIRSGRCWMLLLPGSGICCEFHLFFFFFFFFCFPAVLCVLDDVLTGCNSMLAVMTMNVGYFISVLGGTFLGSLLLGRFTALDHH